jgi:hypothetical protein
MKWYVIRNPQWKYNNEVSVLKRGWGNGYVAVPPTHPAYKMDYATIIYPMDYATIIYPIDVHGSLTYSDFGNGQNAPKDWWVFGFDTSHYNDNLDRWPKEAVEAETKRLYCQLLDIEWGEL